MEKTIKIEGMSCSHCVKSVQDVLSELEGVKVKDVKVGEATVEFSDDYDIKKIKDAIFDEGYEVIE